MSRMHEELKRATVYHQYWRKADWLKNAEEMAKYLSQCSDEGRVECREGLNAEGLRVLWLTVTDVVNGERVQLNDGWNNSFPCPPLC